MHAARPQQGAPGRAPRCSGRGLRLALPALYFLFCSQGHLLRPSTLGLPVASSPVPPAWCRCRT